MTSSGSSSFVVPPHRPLGLMVLVLLVDLGLAVAGAVLLYKGLADDDDSATAAPVEPNTEAPSASAAPAAALAPATAPETTAIAAPTAVAPPPPEAAPSVPAPAPPAAAAAARKDDAKQRDDQPARAAKTTPAKAKSTSAAKTASTDRPVTKPSETSSGSTELVTSPSEPEDPYQPPDTAREIDVIAGRSKAAFDRCEANFGPARGTIQVAFQVRGDGRVINAAAVENSTGNTDLANCLVTVVSSWRVSAHHGAAINMVRPFNYP